MTSAETQSIERMTADEFLAWDGDGHQGKLELVQGEILAMSPASATHGIIQATIARLIGNHLASTGSPCRVGTETPMQPGLLANTNIRVPDLAVTCQPPKPDERLFPDPILIVEILSPSNERDTWNAIHACVTIPSITEVLVLDSERIHAQVFVKNPDGGWPMDGVTSEAGGHIKLTSIDAEFSLADIYADTHLAEKAK